MDWHPEFPGHHFPSSSRVQERLQDRGTNVEGEKQVVRWAAAGGGWRAMAQSMGLANVFARAGLLPDLLSAITTESGSSWFALQLFFSEPYYNATVKSEPEDLATFILQWMKSYRDFTASHPQGKIEDHEECRLLELINAPFDVRMVRMIYENCATFVSLNGDWGDFIEGMLASAAAGYGDHNLAARQITPENRVTEMQSTDVGIQVALVPNTRIRDDTHRSNDRVVHIGRKSKEKDASIELFSTPIGVQWFVTEDDASYISNTENGTSFPSSMVTHEKQVSKQFEFEDWQKYLLFSSADAAVHYTIPLDDDSGQSFESSDRITSTSFRTPYGGKPPTVAQMAAASSAVGGFFSGICPSTFAQTLSPISRQIDEVLREDANVLKSIGHRTLESIANEFYQSTFFDNMAVCSQWPLDCDERDGRFVDGYAADTPTAALNVGHYMSKSNYYDPDATIKLILTPGNQPPGHPSSFAYLLSYFETPSNEGIQPGEFLWPSSHFLVPLRSPQIFDSFLDLRMLNALWEPIPGLDIMKSARLQTKTLANEAFHVRAGTPVDILILQLSSDVPTEIIGVSEIDLWTKPLATLAEQIASSAELLTLVKDFMSS